MIQVKNITKSYGHKKVVDNLSFTIPKGCITSFIGPNGAGKSTVLSMICKILSKDEGEIYIEGKEISGWTTAELSKKVAFLKQINNVNIRLTVEDLVGFGRFPHSQGRLNAKDLEKIEAAISYMELDDIRHKFLDELSGGQRQRAYIGMVIAQDTDYILLDEPLNNLDIKYCVQIMKILRRLANQLGKTIIIVIHDINFASFYSDYILALKGGNEAYIEATREIMTEDKMSHLYNVKFKVMNIEDKKLCMYYQ